MIYFWFEDSPFKLKVILQRKFSILIRNVSRMQAVSEKCEIRNKDNMKYEVVNKTVINGIPKPFAFQEKAYYVCCNGIFEVPHNVSPTSLLHVPLDQA